MKKEVKIGLVMVFAIAALFWGANYLKGIDVFSENNRYYAVYDHVDGLGSSSPVILNGAKVGQVESVDFNEDGSGNLIVTFTVAETRVPIPEDTKAKIISSDLLGTKSISLLLGKSKTIAEKGDTLDSEIEATLSESVNQQILPLKNKAEELIGSMDSAINIVTSIFNKNARRDLSTSFSSISRSVEIIEMTASRVDSMVLEQRGNIDGILTSVASITKNMANNNDELSAVISNMETITDSLAKANLTEAVNNAANSMEQLAEITTRINSGEGSIGALINNDTLYYNLEAAARDLDKLLLDMRLNPERYVHFSIFGRKKKEAATKDE